MPLPDVRVRGRVLYCRGEIDVGLVLYPQPKGKSIPLRCKAHTETVKRNFFPAVRLDEGPHDSANHNAYHGIVNLSRCRRDFTDENEHECLPRLPVPS